MLAYFKFILKGGANIRNGYDNEFDFVLSLNNKKVLELNPMLSDLIYGIFNNIKKSDIIKSWRNHYDQKTDVFIKIGNAIKGISIKMGSRNSVHVEHIDKFVQFLKDNGLSKRNINKYLKYHYADGTINNTGKYRMSAENYKANNKKSITFLNGLFNEERIIKSAIDRFVLLGNNSYYKIDALVYGTPTDFLWISRNDIVKVLLNKKNDECTSPHFSNLVCQCKGRCLNYNSKYENDRNYVQIKWYSLFDDIIENMNNKVIRFCDNNSS